MSWAVCAGTSLQILQLELDSIWAAMRQPRMFPTVRRGTAGLVAEFLTVTGRSIARTIARDSAQPVCTHLWFQTPTHSTLALFTLTKIYIIINIFKKNAKRI